MFVLVLSGTLQEELEVFPRRRIVVATCEAVAAK